MIKRLVLGLALLILPAGAQAQQSPFQAAGPALPVSGTWTPTDASGASLTFTAVSAGYTQIGNMVFVYGTLTYPSTANGSNAAISGLPFAPANQNYAPIACWMSFNTAGNSSYVLLTKNSTTFNFETFAGGSLKTNANMSSGVVAFNCAYPVN